MNNFSINDSNVLDFLGKNGIRHKNPCVITHLIGEMHKNYHMSTDEIIASLEYLEKIGYIEANSNFLSLTEQFDKQIYERRSNTMHGQYTIEQKKAARFKMLEKIYQESGGSENARYNFDEIGEVLQLPPDLNEITYNYLVNEGLLKFADIGGNLSITHFGIVQYEKAVNAPDKATSEYFLPVNIINNFQYIEKVEKSPIQIGNINSQQTINGKDDYTEIRNWIQCVVEALKKEKEDSILEKIQDDIELIKMNISSEKPNNKYIGIALRAIEGVLIGVTSNAIFQELLKRLPSIIP